MSLSERQINEIVEQVVRKISPELSLQPHPEPRPAMPPEGHPEDRRGAERRFGRYALIPGSVPAAPDHVPETHRAPAVIRGSRPGIFDDLDSATSAAAAAFEAWGDTSVEVRNRVIEAMRQTTRELAPQLAQMAVEETGLGNVKDKIQKNLLCANKTPGTEILRPMA